MPADPWYYAHEIQTQTDKLIVWKTAALDVRVQYNNRSSVGAVLVTHLKGVLPASLLTGVVIFSETLI
jgi:hypothetical protein